MKSITRLRAVLAYSRRVARQLTDIKGIRKFYLVFNGFTPNKGYLYDFKKYGYKNFVKDTTRYFKHVRINSSFQNLFRDKYVTYLWLTKYLGKVAPVSALIEKGQCHPLNGEPLTELLKPGSKFVMKPRMGWGGRDVHILEVKDGEVWMNGKKTLPEKAFKGLNNYILAPYIYQHTYAASVYPKSLNTIRFLTCVLNDEVYPLEAIHRFGSSTTGNVDNFSQGGISARIDIPSGIIIQAYAFDKKTNQKVKVDFHPDTKHKITGLTVPFWEEIRKEITALHRKIKFIRYIGWDIAITAEGFKIVEANHVSDVDVFQIHEPLLLNEAGRKFYETVR